MIKFQRSLRLEEARIYLYEISESIEKFFPESFRDEGLSAGEGIQVYGNKHLQRFLETMSLIPRVPFRLRVLEVGIARGILALFVKRYFDYEVYGIDLYREDTQFIKPFLKNESINFEVCDISKNNIPFPDNAFNIVFFCEVLEHLRQPLHAMSELRRVLEDKGLLILTTPNRYSPVSILGLSKKNYEDKLDYKTHFREYTLGECLELLHKFGFKVSKVHMCSCIPTNNSIIRFFYKLLIDILPTLRQTIMIRAVKE